MPTLRRIYCIKDKTRNAAPASYVQSGEGAFTAGASLSDDGGRTHTHNAFNCLDDPGDAEDGRLVNRRALFNGLSNTPFYDVYASTGRLGTGTVFKRDAGSWVEVGTGDLETVVLNDAELTKYVTDPS